MYPEVKKRRIRIGLVQTMLPQRVRKDCPPINSLILPGDRLGISKARKWFYFVRFLKVSGEALKFFGRSNSFVVRRRMKLNHMGAEYLSKEAIPYGFHFNHINELILAPREFDFVQNEESSIEHYVGFMPDEERKEEWDENYEAFQLRLKESLDPVIYCSFGTVKLENSTTVNVFISRLMNVIRKRRCFLIVSVSDTLHPAVSHGLPDNVLFLKSAPQLEILSRASLFITHGGLNSIKEAVYAGVPMLVYPLNHKMDQRGNSSRVVFHGLGLRGNLQTDPEASIEQKIDELLGNERYKQKLEELKGIDLTYTSEKFLKLFDHLKPLT
jgi:zeaxanthin glucosyltransferase